MDAILTGSADAVHGSASFANHVQWGFEDVPELHGWIEATVREELEENADEVRGGCGTQALHGADSWSYRRCVGWDKFCHCHCYADVVGTVGAHLHTVPAPAHDDFELAQWYGLKSSSCCCRVAACPAASPSLGRCRR